MVFKSFFKIFWLVFVKKVLNDVKSEGLELIYVQTTQFNITLTLFAPNRLLCLPRFIKGFPLTSSSSGKKVCLRVKKEEESLSMRKKKKRRKKFRLRGRKKGKNRN